MQPLRLRPCRSALSPARLIAVAAALASASSLTAQAPGKRGAGRADPPQLVALQITPTSVTGGLSAAGVVTLSGPAPLGGLKIQLRTGRTSYTQFVTVPPAVSVRGGSRTATFKVETKRTPILQTIPAPSIVAEFAGVRKEAGALTIGPPQVSTFSCKSPVQSGTPISCTVTLNVPAIGLTTVNIARVPTGIQDIGNGPSGSVSIPDGQLSGITGLATEPCCIEPKTIRLFAHLSGVGKMFDVTITASNE
jgi:hypothetical protein